MPAEVDDLRLRPFQLVNVHDLPDGLNAVAAHGNCFLAQNRTERRIGGHAGIHVGVREDEVGLGLGVGRGRSGLLRETLRRTQNGTQHGTPQTHPQSKHHSPTPASAIIVSKIRFRPNSRPLESNHSCNVCAPPPDPPPPMAIASCPSESGIFASVDARCTCAAFASCESTARTTCKIRAPAGNSPAGRLPITTTSQLTPDGRFCAEDRISAAMVSSSTARFSARRSDCSSRSISVIDVERISTFILAASGMEFTEVPPRITPILNVVFGVVGTGVAVKVSIALARITIGLGAPKSLHECPPGPRTITSKRRLPRASATIVSAPAPSSTRL